MNKKLKKYGISLLLGMCVLSSVALTGCSKRKATMPTDFKPESATVVKHTDLNDELHRYAFYSPSIRKLIAYSLGDSHDHLYSGDAFALKGNYLSIQLRSLNTKSVAQSSYLDHYERNISGNGFNHHPTLQVNVGEKTLKLNHVRHTIDNPSTNDVQWIKYKLVGVEQAATLKHSFENGEIDVHNHNKDKRLILKFQSMKLVHNPKIYHLKKSKRNHYKLIITENAKLAKPNFPIHQYLPSQSELTSK